MQVGSQEDFDLFCFRFRPAETKKDVVCIAHIGQSPVGGIIRISSGVVLHQTFGRLCLLVLSPFSFPFGLCLKSCIDRVVLPHCSLCVVGAQIGFYKVVELIQVDIGEQRTQDPSLWRAALGAMIAPFLSISSLKQMVDQT